MAVIMRDAVMPNLMQTLEGQTGLCPCRAIRRRCTGNSSILADQIALQVGDYVMSKDHFGADIGMQSHGHQVPHLRPAPQLRRAGRHHPQR